MSGTPTAFARGATVYLDTNPIIYLTEGNPAFKAQIASLFEALDAADARLVTSELTLAEVLVRPLRTPDAIHVATAALVQASHFVSGDAGIRTLPEGMQRVQL